MSDGSKSTVCGAPVIAATNRAPAGIDITERRQAETRIREQSGLLKAINTVFQETLMCETEEDLGLTCL